MARKSKTPSREQSSRVPVELDRWSESSKKSYIYMAPPSHYKDEEYACYKCGAKAVFSAEDQKEAFEVRKAYIWQRRILCETCFRKVEQTERCAREFEQRWKEDKEQLRKDIARLREWLQLLEELPRFGRKRNNAKIAMLKKLIIAQQGAAVDAAKRRD